MENEELIYLLQEGNKDVVFKELDYRKTQNYLYFEKDINELILSLIQKKDMITSNDMNLAIKLFNYIRQENQLLNRIKDNFYQILLSNIVPFKYKENILREFKESILSNCTIKNLLEADFRTKQLLLSEQPKPTIESIFLEENRGYKKIKEQELLEQSLYTKKKIALNAFQSDNWLEKIRYLKKYSICLSLFELNMDTKKVSLKYFLLKGNISSKSRMIDIDKTIFFLKEIGREKSHNLLNFKSDLSSSENEILIRLIFDIYPKKTKPSNNKNTNNKNIFSRKIF
jgi:hypothetical protein